MIYYKIDSTAGQSGSPIITNRNGKMTIIGLHKGDPKPSQKIDKYNFAVMLTDKNINQLKVWQ